MSTSCPLRSSFLAAHEAELADVRRRLARGGITWESTDPYSGPIPDLTSYVGLGRLLASDAVARHREGHQDGAMLSLVALRELTRSARSHPTMISRLVAAHVSRTHAHACRLVGASPGWMAGEDSEGYLPEFAEALAWDAATVIERLGHGETPPWLERPPLWHALRELRVPVQRWRLATAIRAQAGRVKRLAARDACGSLTLGEPLPYPAAAMSDIEPLTFVTWPLVPRRRAAWTQAEWELSQVVFRVHAWRRSAPPGTMPPAAILRSDLCPDRSWSVERQADGHVRVLAWEDLASGGADLLEHVVAMP